VSEPGPDKPVWMKSLQTALMIGLVAGAFALLWEAKLWIQYPGPVPLAMIAIAVAVLQPQLGWKQQPQGVRVALGLLGAGLLLPLAGLIGLAREPDAALLASPYWFFVIGALALGFGHRGRPLPVVVMTFVAIAALRIWGAWQSGFDVADEATWWVPMSLWVVAVTVSDRFAAKGLLPESAPLLAAISWFVLVLVTMTIQESRHPTPQFFANDREATLTAIAEAPVVGWGLGSAQRVFLETATRDPNDAPLTARAVLRLASDVGLLPLLLIAVGALMLVGRALRDPQWDSARIILLGAAGFFLVAMISSRSEWPVFLALLGFSFMAAFAPRVKSTTVERRSYLATLAIIAPMILLAAALAVARIHHNMQKSHINPEAWTFLPTWSLPLRDKSLALRSRQPTDVESLEQVARRWTRVTPHEERAWIELIRVVHFVHGAAEAEPIAREATERLPWSDTVAAWRRRILVELDKHDEALQFLESLRERRGSLPPALRGRLLELRYQTRENQGDGR
jgi:hypothetical protein